MDPVKWLPILLNKKKRLDAYAEEASDWRSCAIGEARGNFPDIILSTSTWDNNPKDKTLSKLGVNFMRAIRDNQRSTALKLYASIQRRIAYLLTEKA